MLGSIWNFKGKTCKCTSSVIPWLFRKFWTVFVRLRLLKWSHGSSSPQVQNGMEKPIAFASRWLSKPEKNYCATRKELLSLITFCDHFRYFLLGREFIIWTDHGALKWLLSFKNPTGQIARWIEIISEFRATIQYPTGHEASERRCDVPIAVRPVLYTMPTLWAPISGYFGSSARFKHKLDNELYQNWLSKRTAKW